MGHSYSGPFYQQSWMVMPYSSINTSKAVVKLEFNFTANNTMSLDLGAEYLVFVSFHSLKREKKIQNETP